MHSISKENSDIAYAWEKGRFQIINSLVKGSKKNPNFILQQAVFSPLPMATSYSVADAVKTKNTVLQFRLIKAPYPSEYFSIECNGVYLETVTHKEIEGIHEERKLAPDYANIKYVLYNPISKPIAEEIVSLHFKNHRQDMLAVIDKIGSATTTLFFNYYFVSVVYERKYNLKDPDFPLYFIDARPLNFKWQPWRVEKGNL